MARLTKSDIERTLLSGGNLAWEDANKKKLQLILGDPTSRRLFELLLKSKTRSATNLPAEFILGLSKAYNGADDPATTIGALSASASLNGPWRLQSIETEGFGGLNIWGGPPFHFDFDQESLLVQGPNGSGKSSLIGAILWALSEERPRDQADDQAHEPKPVFGANDKQAGSWPPIACYPPDAPSLILPLRVCVTLTFKNNKGETAKVERILNETTVTPTIDANFDVPSILLEAGLLMPARLAMIRLKDGKGRLTDAVQTLTGLDDLAAIGSLVESLCHKSREYLSYKRKDLMADKQGFDQDIQIARNALAPVQVTVPSFIPANTDDAEGDMAKFGKMLSERTAELTGVISSDLGSDLKLDNPLVQNQVVAAIGAAQEDLESGLDQLPSWKKLKTISLALDGDAKEQLSAAILTAREDAKEALNLLEKSVTDPKYQLKAVAAQWHMKHASGAVEDCPLCDHRLDTNQSLIVDLEALRLVGDAAARTFDDNLNAITTSLNSSIPVALKAFHSEILSWEPRGALISDLRTSFVTKDRYAKILVKFGALVETALTEGPTGELPVEPFMAAQDSLKDLSERLAVLDRLSRLSDWYSAYSALWLEWWQRLVDAEDATESDDKNGKSVSERLSVHLSRLSDALTKAEPYRKGAESMRSAWRLGKSAAEIEKELNLREAIADSLAPLKSLNSLADAMARDAIEGLSGRIGSLLKNIHLNEQLQFHDARLERKEGLVVRGEVAPELRIDATLVANTSWLRAVLWAFLFALREEGVEQIGSDPFPLLVFDDPQATFDAEHRHRWTQYIASLQGGATKTQVILTTHDEAFIDLLKIGGVTGRNALIAAAGQELGHVGIFEGEALNRKWEETQKFNAPKAGREYISDVRIYIEGMLRLMLRSEDANVSSVSNGFVLGDCREKIHQLNKKGLEPWNRPQFEHLVDVLGKNITSIKHLEISHHSSGNNLGMSEAEDVKKHWLGKISPNLYQCFRLSRAHYLLHGGLKALHAPLPTAILPEGFNTKVRSIPLNVLGRAAALSNGQVADGIFNLDEYAPAAHKKITLAQHAAYRLSASTLEPVARSGDILIVKEAGEPSEKSLVVALSDDRILARRFEIAENHSDIAVLSAQSINPRQISPPVIAHKATFILHKIVGILYGDAGWNLPVQSEMEICECGGESFFTALLANALGLVEVVGQSAVPHALDGQYLIIKNEITAVEALETLDGKPIIAGDTSNNRYFKRLRITSPDQLVLESLDSGGDYGPVVLAFPGKGINCLERVWPVAGVLFELPS